MQFRLPFGFGRSNPTPEVPPTGTDTNRTSTTPPKNTNTSDRRSSNLPGPRQSGILNFNRFSSRISFSMPRLSNVSGSTSNRPSLTTSMIGEHRSVGNVQREPTTEELIPGIETITAQAIARNDSSKAVDWDRYATEHPSLADNIRALQQDLQRIDTLTAHDIRTTRVYWYGLISRSKEKNTPKYQQEAKEATKKTHQERFLHFGQSARELQAARHNQRAQLIEKSEMEGVEQFVKSFDAKMKNDIEGGFTGRLRNIRNKCVEHLQKNLAQGMPLEPLFEVVAKVSPEAVDKFLEEVAKAPVVLKRDPDTEFEETMAAKGKQFVASRNPVIVKDQAELENMKRQKEELRQTKSETPESGVIDSGMLARQKSAARDAEAVAFLDIQGPSAIKDFLQGASIDELDRNGKL